VGNGNGVVAPADVTDANVGNANGVAASVGNANGVAANVGNANGVATSVGNANGVAASVGNANGVAAPTNTPHPINPSHAANPVAGTVLNRVYPVYAVPRTWLPQFQQQGGR
jgi:hypothetical protein